MTVIYVAGPLGFSEAGRGFYYGTLLPELRKRDCSFWTRCNSLTQIKLGQ